MSGGFVFQGWRRPDGRLGIRNHCLVLATVSCAAAVVREVSRRLPAVVAVEHAHGCGRGGPDLGLQVKTLAGLVQNPNVGAAVLVGLGCEVTSPLVLKSAASASGKPVETVVIQEAGGSRKATDLAETVARRLLDELEDLPREAGTAADLVVGLKCGASDTFSGLTANPAVGKLADRLVALGGTAILGETTEMIGALGPLLKLAETDDVAARIRAKVERQEARAWQILGPLAGRVIAPGNVESGLTTIAEKALGCIAKAGSSPIRQVLDYGDRPSRNGLAVMDTPGYDVETMAGMAAAGAQAILFTTGRGTPVGFPAVPVIKISSTSELYEAMTDDIDLDAGTILAGKSAAEVGEEILDLLLRVAGGEKVKAEINGQAVFAFAQEGPAF
ncbi:MAG TPA: UxaA family hydrolase [Dehalococcoidia bacterium]|nr:UxaA family hydrolase [Dehalococcoidia bacterium]